MRLAREVSWRRRLAGDLLTPARHKTAGETPALRKPADLLLFNGHGCGEK
jgi:hypothetical protein